MGPLTRDVQILGKAAMEESLTPAARTRRRFKAGRPVKTKKDPLTPLEALTRAVTEYTKLQGLMQDEAGDAFDSSHVKAALVYRTTADEAHTDWLPDSPVGIPAFGTKILMLAPRKPVFLGILFYQFEKDAKPGVTQHIFWVNQFVAGPVEVKLLGAARDKARAGGVPWLEN
jgi:hypothetical protein